MIIEDLRVAATTRTYDSAVSVPVYRPFILVSFLSNGTYSKTLNKIGVKRVQPVPRFIYTPLEFEEKQVGVLEISIGKDGPYTANYDFENLRAGTIYYRRGTTNARATGSELKRILNWFQERITDMSYDPEPDSWQRLFEAVHHFEQGVTYLLAVDQIPSNAAAPINTLGMVPWQAVIDFDPASEDSGLLRGIEGTLERHRVIHRVVRDQHQTESKTGTRWFFARGLSGRHNTPSVGEHRTWLSDYKRSLAEQLEQIAGAVNPTSVVALVLWSEVILKNHLRTLIEELYAAFGNRVDVVVVSTEEADFATLVEEKEATFVRMNLRSLCNGIAIHYADLQDDENERYVIPTSSGSGIALERQDWLWLREDIDLIHRSTGLSGDEDEKEYRLGADISWRNLHLQHDCDRGITSRVRAQVESDLRQRQTVRINIYHAPGSGGTTVGRRVAWDISRTFPTGVLLRCVADDTVGRIERIAALTESSMLVVVDGGQHSEKKIDDLYEGLKANQIPAVLLQVLRRFKPQQIGKRQFWLASIKGLRVGAI